MPATPTFSTALLEIDALRPGGISIVAQSGGIATSALSLIQQAGFGCRHMISSGNEAVVGYPDYLYALARDEGTHVIAGYLEGTADNAKLVRALEEARRRRKPVVLIKAGATSASARAAQAHTGALVGEERVVDAVLRELGVIRVYSIEELVDVALLLEGNRSRLPAGPGVGIVTFGGGNGVLAWTSARGSASPPRRSARECVERLRPLLISVATAANPLDLTPTTAFRAESLALLPQALDAVAAEPEIHSDPRHRGLDGGQGRRDRRGHGGLRGPVAEDGLRELALAAHRHPGAPGRPRRSTPSSIPSAACRPLARLAAQASTARAAPVPPGRRRRPRRPSTGPRTCRRRPATSSSRRTAATASCRRRAWPRRPRAWFPTRRRPAAPRRRSGSRWS